MNEHSDDYARCLEEAKAFHASSKAYSGKFLRPHAPFIKEIIDRLGCKTALDYGAGKGQQYEWVMPKHGQTIEEWWGIAVTKYDPAWPPFEQEPVWPFDLVICTHTLGAISRNDVIGIINRLFSLAEKAIYVAEKIAAPKKRFHSNPALISSDGLTAEQWKAKLWRVSDVELTFGVKERKLEGMISEHWRLIKGEWTRLMWPQGVKALNHEWA